MASILDTTDAWWLLEQGDNTQADAVVGTINSIRNETVYRREMWQRAAEVYGTDLRMFGMPVKNIYDERVSFNVLRNAIHTMQAKLARTMPVPSSQTIGGDWIQRDRAKQLDRFFQGAFYSAQYYKTFPQILLDVLVFGTAAVKVYFANGKLQIERVPIFDLLVSEAEARYGTPRCFYHRCYMDRSVVLATFGVDDESLAGTTAERRNAILTAPKPADNDSAYMNSGRFSDQILVYEATHLASARGAEDGRRIISLSSGVLQISDWIRSDNAGLAFLRINSVLSGFYGPSMALELAAAQDEYDRLSEKIQVAHHLMGGSHIAIQAGTLGKTKIDNDVGTFFEYSGSPPQVFNPQPVHPDTYAYKDAIAQNMLRYEGISELAAQSLLPAGLRQASGRALSVYDDMEDARFRVAHEAVRQFHVDIGWLIVDACIDAVDSGEEVSVLAPSKKALERINWSDVAMDRDDFVLVCEPVSALSMSKAARFSEVIELMDRKLITSKEEAFSLLEIPDVDASRDLETSDVDVVDKAVAMILRGQKYVSPDKYLNLPLAFDRARRHYNKARVDGVAEKRLTVLRQYLSEIEALLQQGKQELEAQQAAAQAQASAPQPGAAPPGAPPEEPQ
jgi:hypothetical protein